MDHELPRSSNPRSPRNPLLRAAGWGALDTLTVTGLSAALTLSPANAAPVEVDAPVARNAQSTPSTPNTVGEARRLGDTFAQVAERASQSVVSIAFEVRRTQHNQPPCCQACCDAGYYI
jgi:hypothetical protein